VRLVLDLEPEHRVVPGRGLGEDVAEPGGQRVGVDRQSQLGPPALVGLQRGARLGLQQCLGPAQPDQGRAGRRRGAGAGAADQHLSDGRLQRPDALADRAGGDVQLPGGRLEGAVIDHGHQGGELRGGKVHEAMLRDLQILSLPLWRCAA
jgi:hypothetical protein